MTGHRSARSRRCSPHRGRQRRLRQCRDRTAREHHTLVPVEDATFDGTDLHVGYTKSAIKGAPSSGAGPTLSPSEANAVRKHFGLSPAGNATGDMGDPHENLDQAGTGPAGADDTEGAGTAPPA